VTLVLEKNSHSKGLSFCNFEKSWWKVRRAYSLQSEAKMDIKSIEELRVAAEAREEAGDYTGADILDAELVRVATALTESTLREAQTQGGATAPNAGAKLNAPPTWADFNQNPYQAAIPYQKQTNLPDYAGNVESYMTPTYANGVFAQSLKAALQVQVTAALNKAFQDTRQHMANLSQSARGGNRNDLAIQANALAQQVYQQKLQQVQALLS
jgi:hypothetical protein